MPNPPVVSSGVVNPSPWLPVGGSLGPEPQVVATSPSVRVAPGQKVELTARFEIAGAANYRITCSSAAVTNRTPVSQRVDEGTNVIAFYNLFESESSGDEEVTFSLEAWWDVSGVARPTILDGAAIVVEVYAQSTNYVYWSQQEFQLPSNGAFNGTSTSYSFVQGQFAEAKTSIIVDRMTKDVSLAVAWMQDGWKSSGTDATDLAFNDQIPSGAAAAKTTITQIGVGGSSYVGVVVVGGGGLQACGAVVFARILGTGTQVSTFDAITNCTVETLLASIPPASAPNIQVIFPSGPKPVNLNQTNPKFGLTPAELRADIKDLVPAKAAASNGSLTIVVPHTLLGGGEMDAYA